MKRRGLSACVLVLCVCGCAFAKVSRFDSSGFVKLSEAVPDAVLEVRYYTDYNFVGERIDGYNAPSAMLTKKAAKALREVSDEVAVMGYRLKVYDAYRPQRAVNHFVRWAADSEDTKMKAYFYPEIEKPEVFRLGYVARKSGHSRGSTVDLTLFDVSTSDDVDMGGTFDYFGERSHYAYKNLTEEQKANRKFLREVMIKHGFRAITTEWWHFTLKDEPYTNTYFDFTLED